MDFRCGGGCVSCLGKAGAPLGWSLICLGLVAGFAQLALAAGFADFCVSPTAAVQALLPEDSDTFTYFLNCPIGDPSPFAADLAAASAAVPGREEQIGGSGGSLEPPGPLREPPGPLLTHLHNVYMA